MMSEKGCKRDKNQNIQVFVRLRPLNQRERDIKSLGVVEVLNNREVVVRQSQQTLLTKKFTFDRAFGPHAKQVEVYQDVVSPLIEEVLAGYNCTVFAYGQTGTGKTHTMVGESTTADTTWQNDPLSGIIPRALSQLFDELRITNTEYTVRVSYLELYNEELFDLLSSSEDNSKLRIYEDVTRKGSNIVNGLEEITVHNKNEVYKIMSQGQERKRVASTLMNAQSSRSHTVFTIVVHMKENSPEGEELVKIGKLNLVDLAGSENISKAGSDNPAKRERARECVNINQSLLTLGRVITALVERHPHIPYRESKLTRILQESLGGRTKTSIIATISPGHKDLEETMSTLEYAHRAKNIQNKPEINQKLTKKAILKEFVDEIDKLKRDLQAARDKNGVYLASDTFTEMTLKQEEQRKEIQELLLKKRAMEEDRDRMENIFADLNLALQDRDRDLRCTKEKLTTTELQLAKTNNLYRSSEVACVEQRHLVEKLADTEKRLGAQAQELLATADLATNHVASLHDTVDKRRSVESSNLEVRESYRQQAMRLREHIANGTQHFTQALDNLITTLHLTLNNYTTSSTETQNKNKQNLEELVQNIMTAINEIKSTISQKYSDMSNVTQEQCAQIARSLSEHTDAVQAGLSALVDGVRAGVQLAHNVDVKGDVGKFVNQWYSGAGMRVSSLRRAHGTFAQRVRAHQAARAHTYALHADRRRDHAQHTTQHIQQNIQKCNIEKAQIQESISKELSDIETERQKTQSRLDCMEEMRRQLSIQVENAKNDLDRLNERVASVEQNKQQLEERIDEQIKWMEMQLQANEEEIKMADKDLEECENGREECDKAVEKYSKEFDEGTSAISIDMEVFNTNIVEVVEHINDQLLRALDQAKEQIEQEVVKTLASDKAAINQMSDNMNAMFARNLNNTKLTLDKVVSDIEANNTSTINKLNQVTGTSSELVSLSQSHQRECSLSLSQASRQLSQFEDNVREALRQQAQLEDKCLLQEYRLYSPTGKTPSRVQYQYPRGLAVTSPHDRILARFRAMREELVDDDIILVEAESQAVSDSESSASSDSGGGFLVPSPPLHHHQHQHQHQHHQLQHRHQQPALNAIVKSTSETDIYAIRRQQEHGKENPNQSVTYKKPSKLKAPSSHKKPLAEQNSN